jgi:AAA family ATP:ADP antiporter
MLGAGAPRASVAPAFFVWLSVFNLFVVSAFWSLMADLFSQEQGKRLFGFVSAGGTAGAVAGPLLTAALVHRIGTEGLLFLAAVLLELAVLGVGRVVPRGERGALGRGAPVGGGVLAGVRLSLGSPYLLGIAAHVLAFTMTATVLYFAQAKIVSVAVADPAGRTAVFARIDFLVNVLVVVIQTLLTGRVLRRAGVGPVLALLPVVTLAALGGLALAPVLAVLVASQTARRAAGYALERPAREVLFTVVTREEKYKAKSFIDTVVYRGGDALSAWASAGLTALGLGVKGSVLMAVPLTVAWVWLALALGRQQQARSARVTVLPLAGSAPDG